MFVIHIIEICLLFGAFNFKLKNDYFTYSISEHLQYFGGYLILLLINLGANGYCITIIFDTNLTSPCADQITQSMLNKGQNSVKFFLWLQYLHFGLGSIAFLFNILISMFVSNRKVKYY